MSHRAVQLVVLKLIGFTLLVVGGQIGIYKLDPFQHRLVDFPPLGEFSELDTIEQSDADVLYLGDSTIYAGEGKSIDKQLQDLLPEHRVRVIAHPAYHMGVFEAYLKRVLSGRWRPKYVVLPINLRSFSVSWDQRPEYQFEELRLRLAYERKTIFRVFYRPLKILKQFNLAPIREDEFDRTPIMDGGNQLGFAADFKGPRYDTHSAENLQRIVQFHYMFALEADSRKAKQMLEINDLLTQHGVVPIFYLTPIDHQACSEAIGPHFDERLAENVKVIQDLLRTRHATPLELSRVLGTEQFDWQRDHYPNEHLTEAGRRSVAERLAQEIRAK